MYAVSFGVSTENLQRLAIFEKKTLKTYYIEREYISNYPAPPPTMVGGVQYASSTIETIRR